MLPLASVLAFGVNSLGVLHTLATRPSSAPTWRRLKDCALIALMTFIAALGLVGWLADIADP